MIRMIIIVGIVKAAAKNRIITLCGASLAIAIPAAITNPITNSKAPLITVIIIASFIVNHR